MAHKQTIPTILVSNHYSTLPDKHTTHNKEHQLKEAEPSTTTQAVYQEQARDKRKKKSKRKHKLLTNESNDNSSDDQEQIPIPQQKYQQSKTSKFIGLIIFGSDS